MDNPTHPPEYWKALTLRAMRLAVRIALKSSDLSVADLKALLEIAIYRELQAHGYSTPAMSVQLGCSQRTIKRYAAKSKGLSDGKPREGQLNAILTSLRTKGPQTYYELSAIPAAAEEEFDSTRVALSLLIEQGLVRELPGRTTKYQAVYEQGEKDTLKWKTPLSKAERQYASAMNVLQCLFEHEATLAQLRQDARLKPMSEEAILNTLEVLEKQGYIASRPGQKGEARRYFIQHDEITLIPEDPVERTRVGLLDMLHKIGMFLDTATDQQNQSKFSQRAWVFGVLKADLLPFIKRHKAFVVENLRELELRARDHPNAVRAVMIRATAQL